MTIGRWILLVEDDPNDSDLAIRALSGEPPPPKVILAPDGERALDCLNRQGQFHSREEGLPAVVLLDLKLPRMDGLEVLRQIKNTATLKTTPVVVFSSSREPRDITRASLFGANAFVVKPLILREFQAVLQDVKKFWLTSNEPAEAQSLETAPDPAPLQQAEPTPAT